MKSVAAGKQFSAEAVKERDVSGGQTSEQLRLWNECLFYILGKLNLVFG